MTQLLATAATLDDVRKCVARFYCGESKTLLPRGPDRWIIAATHDGAQLLGVHVIRKAGRFRFETCADLAPITEPGAEGKPQLVIPGAEKIGTAQLLARKMDQPKRAKCEQREPGGLFSATVRDQLSLF